MKKEPTDWELAKFRAMFANNSEIFEIDDNDEAEVIGKCLYREPYKDPSKPIVTKLSIKEPTTWQIFCSWIINLLNRLRLK